MLREIAIPGQHALGVALPAREPEGEEHGVLGDQEHAETDVGALLAEKLPKFVAQLVEEHELVGSGYWLVTSAPFMRLR